MQELPKTVYVALLLSLYRNHHETSHTEYQSVADVPY